MLLSIGTCLQLLSAMWVICRLVDSKTGSQVGPDTFKDTDESLTLGAVFHTLEAPTGLSVKKVYLSATGKPSDSWTAAELTHPVSLSSQFGKPYLKFMVEAVQPALNSEGNENAFDRLMAGARRLSEEARQARMPHLPDTKDSSSPGYTQKDALYNYIILDVLKKNSLLFENKHVADTDGTMLLRVLTDVLWNIDEHHEKINHRATFSAEIFPCVFLHCGDRDCTIISELKHSFQTVLPICLQCRSTKEPVTRGKFKHPSSSDKGSSAKRARFSN